MRSNGSGVTRAAAELEALYRRPGFLLRRANQIAEALFSDECAQLDLTPAQCGSLLVARACPGLDQTGMALAMGFDRATMGEILRKLEARGLMLRTASSSDARRRHIAVTPQGEEVLRKVPRALARAQERLLAPYTDAERELLLGLLERMCETFNASTRSPLVRPAAARGASPAQWQRETRSGR